MKKIYLDSSVISYLSANPSRDIVTQARQRISYDWVARWREDIWEVFVSKFVLDEIALGDPDAAKNRLIMVQPLSLLPFLPEAERVASRLVSSGAVPEVAQADAMHLAMAAVHKIDYLLTWNQKHLDNPILRNKIEAAIVKCGYSPTIVLSPERLLEISDGL